MALGQASTEPSGSWGASGLANREVREGGGGEEHERGELGHGGDRDE